MEHDTKINGCGRQILHTWNQKSCKSHSKVPMWSIHLQCLTLNHMPHTLKCSFKLRSEKNVTFQIKPSTSRKSFQSHCYQKQSPRLVLLQVLHFFPLVLFFFCFIFLPLSLFFFLAQITNTYKIPLYLRESALYAGWGFLGSNPGTATSRDMTLDKWLYLSPSVSSSVKWRRKEFISPKCSIDD